MTSARSTQATPSRPTRWAPRRRAAVLSVALLALPLIGATAAEAQPASPSLAISGGLDEGWYEFATPGLPAVSVDGQRVAVAYQGEDGARGNPNLALRVIRVADDVVELELPVLAPDELESGAVSADRVLGRIDAANAYLASSEWRPLTPAEVAHDDDIDPMITQARLGDGQPLEVLFHGARLAAVSRTRNLALHGPAPDWSAPPADDVECRDANAPYLSGVFADLESGVLLLETSYLGNDTCWEPDSVYHVVRMAPLESPTACALVGGTCMEGCEPGFRQVAAEGCFDSACCLPRYHPTACALVGGQCREQCDPVAPDPAGWCAADVYCCPE